MNAYQLVSAVKFLPEHTLLRQ